MVPPGSGVIGRDAVKLVPEGSNGEEHESDAARDHLRESEAERPGDAAGFSRLI
jgi:hypothetical protein